MSEAGKQPVAAAPPAFAWPRLRRLRRSLRLDAQTARLASGLVLFAFVLGHLINHALGLVSLAWMDEVQGWRWFIWRSRPGTALLYGAFAVHIFLALWKVVRRTTWRMPLWEAVQIALGILIPVLLVKHILYTRGMNVVLGREDLYVHVLRLQWNSAPIGQSVLVFLVWIHATIGLHHWLKTRAWYAGLTPWLLGAAVLLPVLAVAGWIEAARRLVAASGLEPPWTAQDHATAEAMIRVGEKAVLAVALALLLAIVGQRLVARLRQGVRIGYSDGRSVKVAPGPTLLEISRANGVPHAAICGGRGRCTTCRVLVVEGAEALAAPNTLEAKALTRIGAPDGVRLACQIRPRTDILVRPLVPLAEAPAVGLASDPYQWGIERRITVMFADLRGFTSLAERLYPYDSVFLLNRYFEVMAGEIRANGGVIDKFMGDGIMALFGIGAARGAGSRDAILAAKAMGEALAGLDREFRMTLGAPLRMGLGIHTGAAVLGRVGTAAVRQGGAGLTALGDTVNTASRLESLTKEYGALAMISEAAMHGSGLALPGARTEDIAIRGREQTIHVHIVSDFSTLTDAPGLAAATA